MDRRPRAPTYGDLLQWQSLVPFDEDHIPDDASAVTLVGDLALVPGTGLMIVDVSAPWAPQRLIVHDAATIRARDCAANLTHAFLATVNDGLVIVDISNPAAPTTVGQLPMTEANYSVALAGGYCYVPDGYAGLQVVDVSDPADPVIVGTADTVYPAFAVAVDGDYAYVTEMLYEWAYMLKVVDISDPTDPVILGSVDLPNRPYHVAVRDGHAFVAVGYDGLRIVDVGDPAAPAIVGAIGTPDSAYEVALQDDRAYVAYRSGVMIADISDLTAPVQIGLIGLGSSEIFTAGAAVSGDILLGASGYGLEIRSISAELAPRPQWDQPLELEGTPRQLVVVGNTGYLPLGGAYNRLKVLDLTDPLAPEIIGSYSASFTVWAVAVADGYAYLVGDGHLAVLDVSVPAAPVLACPVASFGGVDVAVAGDYCYLASGDLGVRVVDRTELFPLAVVGSVATPTEAVGICVLGDHAYVADTYSGLQVIDIAVPSAPAVVGSLNPGGYSFDIVVAGGIGYLANSLNLFVLDVSAPTAPAILGTPPDMGINRAHAVTISGDFAYTSAYFFDVYDISEPAAPFMVGGFRRTSSDVTEVGDLLYVSNNMGLFLAAQQCSESVPCALAYFDLAPAGTAVTLSWGVNFQAEPGQFRLTAGLGPVTWDVPCRMGRDRSFLANDESVHLTMGGQVTYRLYHRGDDSDWYLLGIQSVEVGAPPALTRLAGVWPNPFNPQTTVSFSVGKPQQVAIRVYDLTGRRVAELADRPFGAGTHQVRWDGQDAQGRQAASGAYLVRLETEEVVRGRKILLVR